MLLREQLAALRSASTRLGGRGDHRPPACCGSYLSIQRGVLQGSHAYAGRAEHRAEAGGRLVIGLALVLAGLGVEGAYLGTPLSMLATSLLLWVVIRRRLGRPPDHEERRRLRALVGDAWAPILGLTLLAVLQNIDVILVKHQIGGDKAGSYAAAAVAAKAVIWVAVGVGLYLLPEATRRAARGPGRPARARARDAHGRRDGRAGAGDLRASRRTCCSSSPSGRSSPSRPTRSSCSGWR